MTQKKKFIKKIDIATLVVHLLAILVMIYLSAGALRQNNLRMLELRERVFKADESGVGIEESLVGLRNFVGSHMNTKLPKLGEEKAIQLKYSYERAVNAEQKRFQDDTEKTSIDAKKACVSSRNELSRVDCEQNYIKNNPIKPLQYIYPETYSIEYVSPSWSFDLAGWLIAATSLLILLLLARIVALYLARRYIKRNYK